MLRRGIREQPHGWTIADEEPFARVDRHGRPSALAPAGIATQNALAVIWCRPGDQPGEQSAGRAISQASDQSAKGKQPMKGMRCMAPSDEFVNAALPAFRPIGSRVAGAATLSLLAPAMRSPFRDVTMVTHCCCNRTRESPRCPIRFLYTGLLGAGQFAESMKT